MSSMIVITGAAGFIGSAVAADLLSAGHDDLWLVDDFSREDKALNYRDKAVRGHVERDKLFDWLEAQADAPNWVIHLGARTDTTESDLSIFHELNLRYSQQLWRYCAARQVPLIYASSAATYGAGEHGFDDDLSLLPKLQPLNPYGQSKHDFDRWALVQEAQPPFWAGLKFFNVYGPNEYHKGRMASVVFHAYQQIQATGQVKLFRSHRPEWADGEQRRDFVYVKDVAKVIRFLMERSPRSDLYNLGTGEARTFMALAQGVFAALNREPRIQFIDIPADIRERYQYFTEAKMDKLRAAGYAPPFTSLEKGIADYVQHFLRPGARW